MKIKYLKIFLVMFTVLVLGSVFIPVVEVQAAGLGPTIQGYLTLTRDAAGLPTTNSPVVVVSWIVKGALGLVAVIFFMMVIIAGFRWMTAGGNEETITKAKKNISNAIIGLMVILFAYAITAFVFNVMLGDKSI